MDDYELYEDDFEEEQIISGESSRKISHVQIVHNFKTPKTTKKKKPKFGQSPHDRIISAKDQEIKALHNKLAELKKHMQEMTNENRTIKRQQIRYEKELQGISKQESDLPNILQRHKEEVRNLRAQIHRTQLNNTELQKRVNDMGSELWKSRERIKKLDAVSKRRDLPERERLVFQLQEYQEKLDNKEKQITKLEKSLELYQKTHNQELKGLLSKNKFLVQKIEEMKNENRHVRWQLKDKERLLDVTNIYTQRIQYNVLPPLPMSDDQSTQTIHTQPPFIETLLIKKPQLVTGNCQTDSSWIDDLMSIHKDKSAPNVNAVITTSSCTETTPTTSHVRTAPAISHVGTTPISHVITTTPTVFTALPPTGITTTPFIFNSIGGHVGHMTTTTPTTLSIASTAHIAMTTPTTLSTASSGHVMTTTPTISNSIFAIPSHVTTTTPTTNIATPSFSTTTLTTSTLNTTAQQTIDIKNLLFTDHTLSSKPPTDIGRATPTANDKINSSQTAKKELLEKLFPSSGRHTPNNPVEKTTPPVIANIEKPESVAMDTARQATPLNNQAKNDLLSKLFPTHNTTGKDDIQPVVKETSSTSILSWSERIENMHHGLPAMASDSDRYGNNNRRRNGNHSNGSHSNIRDGSSKSKSSTEEKSRKTEQTSLFGSSKIFGDNKEEDSSKLNPTFGNDKGRGVYPWETTVDIGSNRRMGVVSNNKMSNDDDIEELTI